MNSDKVLRLLIADSLALFRQGLSELLRSEKGYFIVGEAENGLELINKYQDTKPDLVITDFHLRDLSGVKAIQRIRRTDKITKFLILTAQKSDEYIYYSLKCGANGLLHKDISKDELFYAINVITNGNLYYGAHHKKTTLKEIIAKYDEERKSDYLYRKINFTDREKDILYLVSEALSSLEIADKLKVSKRTIDTHRANLMQKLNLSTLPEFIKFAIIYSHKQIQYNSHNFDLDI